jgi:hypothetical protein
MPLETMESAICRTNVSVTPQPNLFQLFQPMGGVSARPLFKLGGLAKLGVGALINNVLKLITSAKPPEIQLLIIRLFVIVLLSLGIIFCTRITRKKPDGTETN